MSHFKTSQDLTKGDKHAWKAVSSAKVSLHNLVFGTQEWLLNVWPLKYDPGQSHCTFQSGQHLFLSYMVIHQCISKL